MRKFRLHKCPVCNKPYKELGAFENHMRNEHPGEIPAGWSAYRYTYFLHTGRTCGTCRICGGQTAWNDAGCKYMRLCDKESCRQAYRNEFMKNMRNAGREHFLDDPKVRERMLANRKISGTYTFADGGQVTYMGSLEKNFMRMLDTFLRYPSADVFSPSPNRYTYFYDNPNDPEHRGEHIYIPDVWFPTLNLEVELKSATNKRPDHLKIDVVRDAFKDVRMIRDPSVNYIKLYEEDFHVFFQVLADFARYGGEPPHPIKYVSRALLSSAYMQHIPEDCLKTIKKYIYRYSDKAVMRKAAEEDIAEGHDFMILEDDDDDLAKTVIDPETGEELFPLSAEDDPPEEEEADVLGMYDEDVAEAVSQREEDELEGTDVEELENVSVGLDPYIYYAVGDLLDENEKKSYNGTLKIFDMPDEMGSPDQATEADTSINTNTVAGKAAVENSRWRDKLFGTKTFGKFASKQFVKVTVRGGNINISGINCNLLIYRMQEMYDESRLKHIFEYTYNAKSLKMYNQKRISRGQMKVDSVHAPQFFALELTTIFQDLSKRYRDKSYGYIAEEIYKNSWLYQADTMAGVGDISLEPLSNLSLTLLPHQMDFIKKWDKLKAQLHLNGYILAFQPGKGKTLTAIGLSECIHASHVYIVCPNNLKDNWALEIRKYYTKYADEAEWRRDVCILGTKFGDPKTAKFLIVNNESLKLMQAVAKTEPSAMLILDESHNFRNYTGTRSVELFKLADTIQSNNVLVMSATPIKAAPSEITPALKLIDRTFTDEAAAMYAKCFAISEVTAMKIVERRFGMIMYRPPVEVDLPPKHVDDFVLTLADDNQFMLSVVHDDIIKEYHTLHDKWLKDNMQMVEEYKKLIRQYSKATKSLTEDYLTWVVSSMSSTRSADGQFHELDVQAFKTFIEDHIRLNPNCPPLVAEELANKERTIVVAARSDMGKAIGKILPPRRNEMYIQLYAQNEDRFIKKITERTKKTVIFSTMVPVVEYIYTALNKAGIKTVKVTGSSKNRLQTLTQFKEDPATMVLVATSQTLGVGLTLTEASQMFFFGTPWRSTDYEQACDRIWRIGQTDEVNIWSVMLKSSNARMKNLSTRMKDILEWSDRMFSAAITTSDITGEEEAPAEAAESYIPSQQEMEEQATFLNAVYEAFTPMREAYNQCYPNEPEFAMEAANYDENHKYPVFILLTIGSTKLAKLIKAATGDTFSHSSIAFDISLDPLYSFGTKKLVGTKRELGFVHTNAHDTSTWGDGATPYTLYVTYVSKEGITRIKQRLKFFLEYEDEFKYSFAGLIRNKLQVKSSKRLSWFCSGFVAELLGQAYKLEKDSTLYRPQNFDSLPGVVKVISGPNILTYDKIAAAKALEKVKKIPQDEKGNPVNVAQEGFVPVESQADSPQLQTLTKYFDDLSKYPYGYFYEKKLHLGDDDPDGGERCVVQDPRTFVKTKGGNCFDFTVYQQQEFTRNGLKAKSYFIWMGEELYCHTLTVVEINGAYYWFEAAAKNMQGIYKSDTLFGVFDYFIHRSLQINKEQSSKAKPPQIFAIKDVNAMVGLTVKDVARVCSNGRHLGNYHYNAGTLKPLYCAYGMPAVESEVVDPAMESMEDFRSSNWETRYHIVSDPYEQEMMDKIRRVSLKTTIRLSAGVHRGQDLYAKSFVILNDTALLGREYFCYSLNIVKYALIKLYQEEIMDPLVMITKHIDGKYWPVILTPFAQGVFVIDPPQGLFYEVTPNRVLTHSMLNLTICELEERYAKIGGGLPSASGTEADAIDLIRQRTGKDRYRIKGWVIPAEEFMSIAKAGRTDEDIYKEIEERYGSNVMLVPYEEVDVQERLHRAEVMKHGIITRSVGGR